MYVGLSDLRASFCSVNKPVQNTYGHCCVSHPFSIIIPAKTLAVRGAAGATAFTWAQIEQVLDPMLNASSQASHSCPTLFAIPTSRLFRDF